MAPRQITTMPKQPRRYSPGYLHQVRKDTDEWIRSQVRARDEAARKAEEAERAAVFAELERNKRGEP